MEVCDIIKKELDKKRKKVFTSYAKIQNLSNGKSGDHKNIDEYFKNLAKLLKDTKLSGIIQFRLSFDKPKYYHLDIEGEKSDFNIGAHEKPHVEVLIKPDAFVKIADNSISPIEAVALGKLRIRGDLKLGMKLYKRVVTPKGKLAPCIRRVPIGR